MFYAFNLHKLFIFLVGDTATKYKTLLLNTFLNGIRDEDHLIRTSSLSNLGEICRVLGYKLGTIVNEVRASLFSSYTLTVNVYNEEYVNNHNDFMIVNNLKQEHSFNNKRSGFLKYGRRSFLRIYMYVRCM